MSVTFIVDGDLDSRKKKLNDLMEEYKGEPRFDDDKDFKIKYDSKADKHYVFVNEDVDNNALLKSAFVLKDYLNLKNSFLFIALDKESKILDFKRRFEKQMKHQEMKILRLKKETTNG